MFQIIKIKRDYYQIGSNNIREDYQIEGFLYIFLKKEEILNNM